jgi:hypothetical protein
MFTSEAKNPARIELWPPTLPLEIALRVNTAPAIFRDYGFDRNDYERLCADPAFREAVKTCSEQLAAGGGQMSFKMKAQLMSDGLLDRAFALTHPKPGDDVPPNVQADMIKSVVKWAGLDGVRSQDGNMDNRTQLQIVLHLD